MKVVWFGSAFLFALSLGSDANSAPSISSASLSRSSMSLHADLGVERTVGLVSGRDCPEVTDDYQVPLYVGDRLSLQFVMTEEKFSLVGWEARLVDRDSHDSILIDQASMRGALLEGLHALKTQLGRDRCQDCEIRLTLLSSNQGRKDYCYPVSVIAVER